MLRRCKSVWLRTSSAGVGARQLYGEISKAPAGAILFSDGEVPDPRLDDDPGASHTRVEWAAFITANGSDAAETLYNCWVVPIDVVEEWLPRKTQIVLVELLGGVLALTSQCRRPRGWRVLILVDSEAAEGALVKGYNSLEDISDLIGVFWLMALHRYTSDEYQAMPNPPKGNLDVACVTLRIGERRGSRHIRLVSCDQGRTGLRSLRNGRRVKQLNPTDDRPELT